jgi:MFS family permease
MSKFGRKSGHLLGLFLALCGMVLAGVGLSKSSFAIYCAACALSGVGSAFNNQIRFTAAEAAQEQKALVHSWILMFSLFAAFLGPWIVTRGHELLPYGEYTGSVALFSVLLLGIGFLMSALPEVRLPKVATSKARVSIPEVLSQGKFWIAALSGTASFATMTLLMSATPLQMHEIEHFSAAETTMTIQSHIVAMFLPSLFSGVLLSWLGVRKLIGLGVFLLFVCIGVAFSGAHFHHYWWALVLLGVGWNFLFLASSTWVSQSYSGPDRFVAQGANDALVYGTQSVASLAAGWLLFELGWKTLVFIPVPLLLGLVVFVGLKAPRTR